MTTIDDPGTVGGCISHPATDCSLRDAIASASTTVADTIVFDISLTGETITLGETMLFSTGSATKSVTIDGTGSGITVKGTTFTDSNNFVVFNVTAGNTVVMKNFTISDSGAPGKDGGGIRNAGTLTLQGMTLSKHYGDFSSSGGGDQHMLNEVYDPATHRLTGSAFFGTLSKRPKPWTFQFLLQHPDWTERMPLLLDQLAEDLADPVDGGFFFFFDPDQADFVQARETSKRLDQNAAMLWLFAEAWDHFDEPRYYQIVRRTLAYLREHLWHAGERRFYASQHSDPIYYQQSPETRELHSPPPVDAVTYADFSGQVIAALFRTGMILQDDDVLAWAKEGLEGLDRALWGGDTVGYWHALTADGKRELTGYLPAQTGTGGAFVCAYLNDLSGG